MDVVEMVLSGRVNKGLVTLIQQAGGRAVGVCGKDSGIIKARMVNSCCSLKSAYLQSLYHIEGRPSAYKRAAVSKTCLLPCLMIPFKCHFTNTLCIPARSRQKCLRILMA